MKRAHMALPLFLGFLFACGGPSSEGQGVKTPDELIAEQERLADEQAKQSSSETPTGEAGETDLEKKNKFDKRQADLELKRAQRSAETCPSAVTEESHGGTATVHMVFGNDGHVKDATISAPFDDDAVGKCALNAMKAVVVPPFDGPEEAIDWELNLDKKESDKDDKKGK
jgi:hypothetical protein